MAVSPQHYFLLGENYGKKDPIKENAVEDIRHYRA
jgi:hypothetical protein